MNLEWNGSFKIKWSWGYPFIFMLKSIKKKKTKFASHWRAMPALNVDAFSSVGDFVFICSFYSLPEEAEI